MRSTVELAHALGLRVVAEGIEDAPTLELLSNLGCDLAQGYFICRPKPAAEVPFRRASADVSAAGVGLSGLGQPLTILLASVGRPRWPQVLRRAHGRRDKTDWGRGSVARPGGDSRSSARARDHGAYCADPRGTPCQPDSHVAHRRHRRRRPLLDDRAADPQLRAQGQGARRAGSGSYPRPAGNLVDLLRGGLRPAPVAVGRRASRALSARRGARCSPWVSRTPLRRPPP